MVKSRDLLPAEFDSYDSVGKKITALAGAIVKGLWVDTGADALMHFIHSNRVFEDLEYAVEDWSEADLQIVVREYVDLKPQQEWRGFVWDKKLNALGQYFHWLTFPELFGQEKEIEEKVLAFFETVKADIPLDSYICDFAINDGGRVILIEVNPFDGVFASQPGSTGLFLWDDEADRKVLTEGPFELRIRKKDPPLPVLKTHIRRDWLDIVLPKKTFK